MPSGRRKRPPDLKADEECYTKLGDLWVLEHDDEYGFDQLPTYRAGVGKAAKAASAATTSFTVGEVFSERRSLEAREPLSWREVSALDTNQEVKEPRSINLDVVVRFTLPIWNPLLITCEPCGIDATVEDFRSFILRPNDPEGGVTVWVKNRELSAILLDSDALPDPFRPDCPHTGDLDRDMTLLVTIAKRPELLTITKRASGSSSDCANGCGCSGDPDG